MTSKHHNLVWLDLEMTGLNVEKEVIIEIATIVTDGNLNILAEGPDLVIHQPTIVLDRMDEWCTRQHGLSGLTEAVKESRLTEKDAEERTLAFLQEYIEPGKSPLCGNSIGQDRRFLEKFMPKLSSFVHYRNIDVSTVKELARRWRPDLSMDKDQSSAHRALADIRESIKELRYYRDTFFKLTL